MKHEIIVGNVGTVYSGHDYTKAAKDYKDYVALSKSGTGRAAFEAVTWLREDEIYKEHFVKQIKKVQVLVLDEEGRELASFDVSLGEEHKHVNLRRRNECDYLINQIKKAAAKDGLTLRNPSEWQCI